MLTMDTLYSKSQTIAMEYFQYTETSCLLCSSTLWGFRFTHRKKILDWVCPLAH